MRLKGRITKVEALVEPTAQDLLRKVQQVALSQLPEADRRGCSIGSPSVRTPIDRSGSEGNWAIPDDSGDRARRGVCEGPGQDD